MLGIISSPLSGLLFNALTYVQFFSLNCLLVAIGLIYTLTIDDVSSSQKVEPDQKSKEMELTKTSTKEETREHDKHPINAFTHFFDKKHITKLIEVVKRKRNGQDRKILSLAIFCHALFFSIHGEEGLHILFARTALKWTTEFGLFVMYSTSLGLLGTTIMTTLFVKCLRFEDTTITAISLIGTIISKPIVVCALIPIDYYLVKELICRLSVSQPLRFI